MPTTLPDPVFYAVPFFALAALLELFASHVRKRDHWEVRDALTSLVTGFGFMIINAVLAIVIYLAYAWFHQFRLFDIPITWWAFLLLLPLEDLAGYWNHRIAHERRFWWASHVAHHSSQHFNYATALRQTWTDFFTLGWMFWVPLVLIGFPPEMVLFQRGISLIYAFFLHTAHLPKGPRWVEFIFNTPSHHRVHHASNTRYLDANYAAIFVLWDRLFGTCIEESDEEPVRYGIVKNIATFNPLRIVTHEWAAMFRDVARAPDWGSKVRYVFGTVGWSHDGSRKTTRQMREEWRARRQVSALSASPPPQQSSAPPLPAE